jgi:superfamily II DNA or RNA helicase
VTLGEGGSGRSEPLRAQRRRFNAAERAALYSAADGRCGECCRELDPGWHADHRNPHSHGGPTDVINGQALCPDCNLEKGAHLTYTDTFQPRPFQDEVIQAVLDNHADGTRATIVLAAPGSGKTLTAQAAACHLLREGAIDHVAVLVPRLTLAEQCELEWRSPNVAEPRRDVIEDWKGHFQLFDPRGRIEFIEHTRNRSPLLPPGPRGRGIVSTYSSLVSANGQVHFESFAQHHTRRFLLVADEAQFCGEQTDTGGGTRAGEMVKMLHHYAAHTLLMTGTPYRSDGNPLILAEYGEPNASGLRPLLSHVASTYQDGIREGYLRKFEATLTDARVTRREVATNTTTSYDLSLDGADLRQVLRRPDVWQPIADAVVSSVRDKQHQHPEHRGLISCMEMSEAKEVHKYLRNKYPGLRVSVATSDDTAAGDILKAFKTQPADVLVTVRMAFIGYDCKAITVIGVLTNYRDHGHLMQLAGRGLRAWDKSRFDTQSCRIIAPDDPGMQEFIKVLRQQLDQGLREREEIISSLPPADQPGDGVQPEPSYLVEDAHATSTRAVNNDIDLDPTQLALIETVALRTGITEDRTKLAAFLQAFAEPATKQDAPTPDPAPASTAPPKTGDQRIAELNSQTHQLIREAVTRSGVNPKDPGYRDAVTATTVEVNKLARANAQAAKADEHAARRRRDVAQQIWAQALGVS